jgi:hypothetical protein
LGKIVSLTRQAILGAIDALFDTLPRRPGCLFTIVSLSHQQPPVQSTATSVRLAGTALPALASCFGSAFAILREIATVALCTTAAVAVFATLAAGFSSPRPVVGEVA